MIIVCIRCFIDSTYLSPNISAKPVGWAPFSSWENGDCKNSLAVLSHPAPKCWGHWRWDPGSLGSLSRLTASLLCHSACFPTPNCQVRKCNNKEDSLGESWGWWFGSLQDTIENCMNAFGGKRSCCLRFCFWCVEMSAWYWKVNHTLIGKILCVSGQKSGEQMNETLRFVPVLRNALEWAHNKRCLLPSRSLLWLDR